MKRIIVSIVALTAGAATCYSAGLVPYFVGHSSGGKIGWYIEKYNTLKQSGRPVVIDALCKSSCTAVIAIVPRERICVTKNAILAFHSLADFGSQVPNQPATNYFRSLFSEDIQSWIDKRHALETLKETYLRGTELEGFVKRCEPTIYNTLARPIPTKNDDFENGWTETDAKER